MQNELDFYRKIKNEVASLKATNAELKREIERLQVLLKEARKDAQKPGFYRRCVEHLDNFLNKRPR